MTLIDIKAKALEAHFDKDDKGFRFFESFVESSHNFFPWVNDQIKARAIEIAQEKAYS